MCPSSTERYPAAVSGLQCAPAYTFQVRGFNEYGRGAASAEATVPAEGVARINVVPLSAPDAVHPASINVVHNGTSLSVTWTAPEGAASYDVTYYAGGAAHARAAWERAGTSLTIASDSPHH